MSVRDFASQRLFVEGGLATGVLIELEADQANYLRNVLRLGLGARVLVFNGRDGEWATVIAEAGKRMLTLRVIEPTRPHDLR